MSNETTTPTLAGQPPWVPPTAPPPQTRVALTGTVESYSTDDGFAWIEVDGGATLQGLSMVKVKLTSLKPILELEKGNGNG